MTRSSALAIAAAAAALFAVSIAAGGSAQADAPATLVLDKKIEDAIARYEEVDLSGERAGAAQSLPMDVAGEVVQILGEIVVDRATAEAYRLIEEKLATALACDKATWFRATCAVVRSIRIEDLASAPSALFSALVGDAASRILDQHPGFAQLQAYALLLREVVLPMLAGNGPVDSTVAVSIVHHMVRHAIDHRRDDICSSPAAETALVVAGLVVAVCEGKGLDDCPAPAIIDSLKCPTSGSSPTRALTSREPGGGSPGDRWRPTADRALSLAGKMLVALRAREGGEPDVRARVRAALEAMFQDLCAQADAKDGCRGTGDSARDVDTLRTIALGALDRDTNAIVAAIIRYAEEVLKDKRSTRGLRIAAALLDYASTYAPAKGAFDKGEGAAEAAKAAHAKRTKILESLTEEMTNRAERGGDAIFSLGGSLRGVIGTRWRGSRDAVWTPLQLPLGVGLDILWEDYRQGLHLELGVLDIGQYVALGEDEEVSSPSLADSIAPSVTVGYFFGRSLPVVVGLTGGFAPHYLFDDDASDGERGAWSVGVTAGIYVPLLDMN